MIMGMRISPIFTHTQFSIALSYFEDKTMSIPILASYVNNSCEIVFLVVLAQRGR